MTDDVTQDVKARAERQREKRANRNAAERLGENTAVVVAVGAGATAT